MSKQTTSSEFYKNCPKCNKIQYYISELKLMTASKKNKVCKSCGHLGVGLGKKFTPEHVKKLSISHIGKQCGKNSGMFGKHFKHTEETKLKIGIAARKFMTGRRLPIEHRQSISRVLTGRVVSEKTREKMRISAIQSIYNRGISLGVKGSINFNPAACKFIDNINKCMGLNLQHALNVGEFQVSGYFLDGYDKEKNIIFEYDEPSHHHPKRMNKDIVRQTTIINKLCPILFLRYDEKNNRLYDALTNLDIPYIQ